MSSSEENVRRYQAAMHAMQTGVGLQMEDPTTKETTAKHLRVGVNSAMITDRAIYTLLIAKGIFTLEEYTAALVDAAEEEAADYTQRVRKQFGNDNITLS